MRLFGILVHTPAAKALGWTVFHFLWEGAILALLLVAALAVLRSPRARYAAACAALAAMLAGFGLTFTFVLAQQQTIVLAPAVPLNLIANPETGSGGTPSSGTTVSELLPWLAPFWLAGVLIFHARAMAGWLGVRRLRRRGVCRGGEEWQNRVAALARRLRISRPVELLESCLTDVPIVLGYLRPVILVPIGLLAGLPAAQVEAILTHELAHIRRHDYLLNLLQTVAESLLFFHPAAWWASKVIRAERENCCDDCVLALHGDAREYALALARLEENRTAVRNLAVAATGGHLTKRVRRLLERADTPRPAWTPVLGVTLLLLTMALGLAAYQSRTPERPVRTAQDSSQTPYTNWVKEDAAYIITEEERAAFKRLQTDEEREHFIEQFWLRRDPTPATVENEFKEEHYRRIAYANERYASFVPGWKTDRGRIYIVYGPPDEIESHPAEHKEQWLYHHIQGVGDNVVFEFTGDDYRLVQSGRLFFSTEPGPPLVQEVKAGGLTSMSVPLDFDARQYKITASTRTSAGQPAGRFETTAAPCPNPPGTAACRVSLSPPISKPMAPGVYVTTITVDDVGGSTRKTYTVTYTVN